MEKIKIYEGQEKVLQALGDREMTVKQIGVALGHYTRPNAHVKRLVEVGLIEECRLNSVKVFHTGGYDFKVKAKVYRRVKGKPYEVYSSTNRELIKVVEA